VKTKLGYAWAEPEYWIDWNVGQNPRFSIQIPTSGTTTIWPWLKISSDIRLEILKTQLDNAEFIWVEWNDSTHQITRIVSRTRWDI